MNPGHYQEETRCVQKLPIKKTFTNGGKRSFKGIRGGSNGRDKNMVVRKSRDYYRIKEYVEVVHYDYKAFTRC